MQFCQVVLESDLQYESGWSRSDLLQNIAQFCELLWWNISRNRNRIAYILMKYAKHIKKDKHQMLM